MLFAKYIEVTIHSHLGDTEVKMSRFIKTLSIIVFFILVMSSSLCSGAFADEENEEPFKGVLTNNVLPATGLPVIDAAAAVVMDSESGRVLFSKNPTQKRAMASTTKIMTAIIAIEKGRLDDVVTVSSRAAGIWGSKINLVSGSKYKLEELLYGLLMNSGNDASIAIGEHIGGSIEGFVAMMNAKAKDLGAYNTSFANTHGLDADGHYTTAYDMALITRYALKNPEFSKIVGTVSTSIPGKQLYNTNELLQLYQGADGVKTGYTGKAGRCLVASATRKGMRLISVVLGSPTTYKRALSSKSILDYAFNNYKRQVLIKEGEEIAKIPVHKGVEGFVQVKATETIELPLREDELAKLEKKLFIPNEFEAPVYAGTDAGYVEYLVDGEVIAQANLKSWYNVRRKVFGDYLKEIITSWGKMLREGIF